MANLSSCNYIVKEGSMFFNLKKATLLFFYKGGKVGRNVCRKTFNWFMSPGKMGNICCPECNFHESTRTLWFYLSSEILGKKNKNRFLYFLHEAKQHRSMFAFIHEHAGQPYLLDFEGSTIEGIAHFFQGFGAQPEIYQHVKYNNLPWLLKLLKK
jgi:hypothetical protein